MPNQQSSYRQIMKATSIFGGVQIFQIFIKIVKSKFVAVLLGPEGIGIVGLLNATIGLVGGLTNFALGSSAIKNVAEAHATGNQKSVDKIVGVLRRLVWITGTLGALIALGLSKWLSLLTFGNKDYTLAFVWISITLLFSQLSTGQLVILQGMRKLKYLASANLAGSILGLIITVPLYYIWGINGIVPAIIIVSLASLTISLYFSRKIKIQPIKISLKETINEGKNMLTMGLVISLSSIASIGSSYIIRAFIGNTGGISEVGIFIAGFSIIGTYVGLVFTAMATDYYPRLSAVAHSNEECKQTINQQAEIAILILAPIIVIFIVFIRWVIILLYSNMFIDVIDMVQWAMLGIFFKAASWSIAFILLAKGASKLFLINELIAKIYLLCFNILGYYFWGLTGLGVSFMIGYIIYFIQVFILSKVKYNFTFGVPLIKIFAIQFSLALGSFAVVKLIDEPYSYFIGMTLLIISSYYSYKELDKRIGINAILLNLKKSFLKRNR